jgi:hypothetical protein
MRRRRTPPPLRTRGPSGPRARTVRHVSQRTQALRQVAYRPAPGRGPSASVQRTLSPVLIIVIGTQKDVNKLLFIDEMMYDWTVFSFYLSDFQPLPKHFRSD